jgi:hypothetical protein
MTQEERDQGPGSEEDLRAVREAVGAIVHRGVSRLYSGDVSPEEAVESIVDEAVVIVERERERLQKLANAYFQQAAEAHQRGESSGEAGVVEKRKGGGG